VPLALVAMAVWAGAAAEQPIVVKFSHVVAVDTPKGQAAQFFRERAEVLTGGRVKVESRSHWKGAHSGDLRRHAV
jgi:C4-dicarboxylate-binding protein DctP